MKLDHIKEKYYIWNLRGDRSLARSFPQSAAVTTIPRGHLRSPSVLQPKAHRSPSRNLQHARNPMSPPVEAAPRDEWGLQPSPRQLCSHRAEPWHDSQIPHPWSWAGSQHPPTESPRPPLPLPTGASSTSGSPGHQGGLSREAVNQKRCKMGSMWEQGQCVTCCWHLDSHLCGPYQKDPFEGTWPYFQSLQKNSHIKFLDGSSLLHLNCFHFFINQLVKETYWGHAGLEETAVLLWSWIILFQSHNVRFLRHQFPVLIVQIWELLINNKNQINTSYQIPYEWI